MLIRPHRRTAGAGGGGGQDTASGRADAAKTAAARSTARPARDMHGGASRCMTTREGEAAGVR